MDVRDVGIWNDAECVFVWVRDSHTLDLHCVAMYMLDGENFSFYFGKIARRIRSHTHTQTLTHSHSHRAQFLSAISNSIKTENWFYLSVPLSLCKQQNFLDFRFGVCVWIKFTESRIATQKSLLLNLTFSFFSLSVLTFVVFLLSILLSRNFRSL